MNDKLTRDDISEMLDMALMSEELDFPKMQIDTDHLIQVLELALENKYED